MKVFNEHTQKLLKLLWTVCSEEKLKSCLKLRNFQNPFNKDKTYHAQKIFAPVLKLAKLNFTCTKIAKAWPGFENYENIQN